MEYRITAQHDQPRHDLTYLTDAIITPVSDEVAPDLDTCLQRIREIMREGKANDIEVIYHDSKRGGNYHVMFYPSNHPFAILSANLSQWAEDQRTESINSEALFIATDESGNELLQF